MLLNCTVGNVGSNIFALTHISQPLFKNLFVSLFPKTKNIHFNFTLINFGTRQYCFILFFHFSDVMSVFSIIRIITLSLSHCDHNQTTKV